MMQSTCVWAAFGPKFMHSSFVCSCLLSRWVDCLRFYQVKRHFSSRKLLKFILSYRVSVLSIVHDTSFRNSVGKSRDYSTVDETKWQLSKWIVEARDDVSNMLLYFVVAEFELRTGKWVLIRCNTGQCNRAHRVLFCVFYKQSGFDSQTWQTHTLCWYDLVTALLSVTAWRSNFYVVVSVPWTCLREWPTEVIERVPSKER